MNKSRPVKGVGWDIGTLGNATWEGAKLSGVLNLQEYLNIPSYRGQRQAR